MRTEIIIALSWLPSISEALQRQMTPHRLRIGSVEQGYAPDMTPDNSHLSLLETAAGERSRSHSKAGPGFWWQHKPSVFDDFAQAESTYDPDGSGPVIWRGGEPHIGVLDGWDPKQTSLYPPMPDFAAIPRFFTHKRKPIVTGPYHGNPSAEWFDESPSADYVQAWNTHYPSLQQGLADHSAFPPRWLVSGSENWLQNYYPSALVGPAQQSSDNRKAGAWFDSSIDQYDGFGRPRAPNPGSPRSYITWQERSVNTTLMCADPGCTANTTLYAPFNPKLEEAANCRLSVPFYATDYDDAWSGERVEFVQVNDHIVTVDCFPLLRGCATEPQKLFECVSNYPIDVLIANGTQTVAVAAKIPEVVDECAYQGNLLSAVPMITCNVRPLCPGPNCPCPGPNCPCPGPLCDSICPGPNCPCPGPSCPCPGPTCPCPGPDCPCPGPMCPPGPPNQPFGPHSPPINDLCPKTPVTTRVPLRCLERGCIAHADMRLNDTADVVFSNCQLTVSLLQTDFDGEHGSREVVEYVNVSNRSLKTNIAPGKNPCACGDAVQLPEDELNFTVMSGQDVTADAADGRLEISMKISDLVDECPAEGYLLNGVAELTCNMDCSPMIKAQLRQPPPPMIPTAEEAASKSSVLDPWYIGIIFNNDTLPTTTTTTTTVSGAENLAVANVSLPASSLP